MSKRKTHFKPSIRAREQMPIPKKTKEGILLMCPFCTPTHALVPGQPSNCGTNLKVTALQEIISARTARLEKLVCVKCHEIGGGEMVRYFNGYLHLEDCNPEMQLLTQPPVYSKWAEYVYRLPERIRALIEKRTGIVQVVREITPEGEETGNIQGYFFGKSRMAGKAVPDGR